MTDRRAFIVATSASLALVPLVALAQQADKVRRIGYLSTPTRASVEHILDVFLRKLRDLGWVEGQNLIIEYRWAEGDVARLPDLAAELARRKVDVIVAPAASAALAAKNATSSIPIVMVFPSDPVERGLVASLARPGGNITGTTLSPGQDIFGKRLQILKEAIPRASRVAILWNPEDPAFAVQLKEVEATGRSMGLRLQHVEARGPQELDGAFAAMARERADALLIAGGSTSIVYRKRIADLALKGRLPAISGAREFVETGLLMAYGVNMTDFVGHAAVYVDKILRGANPADLPVEQPNKFELSINLKTAKALGITLPQPLLLRADEVIQ